MLLLKRIDSRKWLTVFAAPNLRTLASSPVRSDFILKSKFPEIGNTTGITLPEHLASFEKPSWKTSIAFVSHISDLFIKLYWFNYFQECGITGAKISHKDVFRNSKGFAAALQKFGLRQNDAVGVILPNNIHYSSILLGIMDAGLTACPVNPAYQPGKSFSVL